MTPRIEITSKVIATRLFLLATKKNATVSSLREVLLEALTSIAEAQKQSDVEVLEGMKRTDETQMNDDHVWDEALDEAVKKIQG